MFQDESVSREKKKNTEISDERTVLQFFSRKHRIEKNTDNKELLLKKYVGLDQESKTVEVVYLEAQHQ